MLPMIGAMLGSAVIGGLASRSAAKTQAASADAATQLQRDIFNRQTELNEPWRQAGVNALGRMQSGDIGLTQDPSYAFRFSEGLRALERLQAAGGKLYSGGTARAATRFGQDLASTEYGNAWNRLASLAGIGQTATGAQASAAGTYGARAGDLMTSAGAARASGYVGGANALNQALSQGMNMYQTNQLMSMYGPRAAGAPAQVPSVAPPAETTYGDPYAPFAVGSMT